jgi:hypothetical protein
MSKAAGLVMVLPLLTNCNEGMEAVHSEHPKQEGVLMNQPDHASLLTSDASQQMRLAAKSMRDLAFGLEQYASEPCFSAINKISRDLNRIGWNALYTSLLMADLADALQEEVGDPQERVKDDVYYQQLDALLTATNYFSRSIAHLKCIGKNIQRNEESRIHSAELYHRLKEVAHECRSL